jgi:hypothetical protein
MEEYNWYEIPSGRGMSDADYRQVQRQRATEQLSNCAKIEERQFAWFRLNLWYATLYNNRELVGFRWGADVNDQSELWPVNLRTENLIENIGQTMLAKAASSPLRPTLIPHGASMATARAVKTADRFVFGLWRQTSAEHQCLQMFNDAYTTGLGCLQVSKTQKDQIVVEPVFYDNVVIDNMECANRAEPQTFRIRKAVPLSQLKAMYKKDVCGDPLEQTKGKYLANRSQGKEWEIVVETWRLPDPDGKNGYHGIVAAGRILFEEVWKESWVPLVFFHWTDRGSGFFSKGGIEQVIPYQLTQNDLNDRIDESQRISCAAGLMASAATQFDWSQWYSDAGRIVLFHGMEPKPLTIPTNLAELYQERQRNKDACYSHMGLNEMFAMGDYAPSVRFDSSAGLREARNMEDARHLRLWTAYERARLELARVLLRVTARMDKDDFKVTYKPYGASFAGTDIQYKDIKLLTESEYEWEMAPASLAQMSPAARRETLMAKLARGQMEMGEGADAQMVTSPDLEMLERFELASEEDIERHIELLETGKYEKPGFLTNKTKGMILITANYHRLRRYNDVDPQILKNHEQWVISAASQQKAALQQSAMMQGQQMGMQPGPGGGGGMVPYQPTQGMPGTSAAVAAGGQ